MTVHNISSVPLQKHDLALLTKGLSFSPTSKTPLTMQHIELMKQFNSFEKSLRSIDVHATNHQ